MISSKHFTESSHWYLRSASGGNISLRWLKQDDGSYKASLIQYASVTDRNYKAVDRTLGEDDAYDRVLSAIGKFAETLVERDLAANGQVILNLRVGMLPSDKDPFKLQHGTGKAGNGFLVASRSAPGRLMLITVPETQYDPGKKAAFIEIEKSDEWRNNWREVPLSPELIAVAKTYSAPWMRKALEKFEETARTPSFSA